MLYTKPVLYVPKDERGKPVIDAKRPWYVWYRYFNPYTEKMQKINTKSNINRFKTITERKKAGNRLRKALNRWLQEGNSPFEVRIVQDNVIEKETFNTVDALELAFKEKSKVWSERSIDVFSIHKNIFIDWLRKKKLHTIDITKLKKRHVVLFLKYLTDKEGRGVSTRSRNNYKRTLSTLFTQLVDDDIIEFNFIKSIPTLKSKAHKNTPFTTEQLKGIKEYCLENDILLYQFIRAVMYGFLREVEVCRIKVKDINVDRKTIRVQSKTEHQATILIIDKFQKVLNELEFSNYQPNDYLFTNRGYPYDWQTKKEKSKPDFFGRRFKKLKEKVGDKLQLNDNHGIYSARHTTALNLFFSLKKQGLTDLEAKHKLMTITRHKSLSGLESYLRDIGASLPDDYSEFYTLDF